MNIISALSRVFDWCFGPRAQIYVKPLRKVQVLFSDLVSGHLEESQTMVGSTKRYVLDFSASRTSGQHPLYPEVYLDTSLGFVLCVQSDSGNIPIVVIGFERRSTYFFVQQLENIRQMEEYLPFEWEKLLYKVLIMFGSFSRELGVKEVRVCPAHRSPYHPFGNQENADGRTFAECYELAKRLYLLHDLVPLQCGFRWNDPTKTYTFMLSQ